MQLEPARHAFILSPMPLVFDHAQTPPAGYSFPDPSGFTLKAESLRGLLTRVADYRRTNGFSPGNPASEIEAYYLIHHPWLVTKVGKNPAIIQDPVERWINRMWLNPPKEREFAESETIRSRLETCTTCPNYVESHPFSIETRRRLEVLGVGRISSMSTCKVHHWAVGLAVFINTPEVTVVVEECWAQGSSQ